MKKKILLCGIVIFIMCLSSMVYADCGPKPSVNIEFLNIENTTYYATLLSEEDSTGPYYICEEDDETKGYGERGEYQGVSFEIWEKFADYKDEDGFYFICNLFECSEDNELIWGYYPPEVFKVLIYFPESDTFYVSEIYEKYAFDSYYTIDMQKVIENNSETEVQSTDGNIKKIEDVEIKLVNNYDYEKEITGLIVRIIITITIEIAIALFLFRKDKIALLFIIVVNIVTQIILNLMLNEISYYYGYNMYVSEYTRAEMVVFIIEALAFMAVIPRFSKTERKNWVYVAYSAVSNLASFLIGMGLSDMFPEFF